MAQSNGKASIPAVSLKEDLASIKEETPFQIVLKRFRRHKLAMASMVVMIFIFLLSLFAMQIAPFTIEQVDVNNRFLSPGTLDTIANGQVRVHFLGTDEIGRDLFSRLIFAGRISLTVAFLSVIISTTIGVIIGAISGFFGGILDTIIMRFVEFLLTIPTLPILLIISAMLLQNPESINMPKPILQFVGALTLLSESNAQKVILIVIVLAGLGWLNDAQLMRGMVLSLREQTFVEAARSLGASNVRIIFRHMIPNAMAPIIVNASLGLAGYIVAEASLSFLGFGIQDPIPTWGNMLAASQRFMLDRPWLPLIPGLPIFVCSLAFNYIGDGLRDALDPRLKL
jgi:peptide/nickel transport system permease protein